jgi:ADP-ribose pyrophosphatase
MSIKKIHLFLAYDLTRGETNRDVDEFITVEVVPLTAALEMIRDGRIKDAKTALGILYAAGFRVGT